MVNPCHLTNSQKENLRLLIKPTQDDVFTVCFKLEIYKMLNAVLLDFSIGGTDSRSCLKDK